MKNYFLSPNITVRCIAVITLLLSHFPAFGKVQELATIEAVVAEFIEQEHPEDAILNVELQRLDNRLKLAACEEDLQVKWSTGSRRIGRTTVAVSCSKPKPWRIFVRATVEIESLAWVLNSSVRKGDVLSRRLISQQSVLVGQGGYGGILHGSPIVDIEPYIGKVFVQAMQAGRILGDQALKLPDLVSKGDPVAILYQSAHLAIRAKGVALESGSLKEKISVKNSVTNKVIDAIVTGRSHVAISP